MQSRAKSAYHAGRSDQRLDRGASPVLIGARLKCSYEHSVVRLAPRSGSLEQATGSARPAALSRVDVV